MPNEGLPPLQQATLYWLFGAYAVVWGGIMLFLMNMRRRQDSLERQLQDLERAIKH